MSFGVLRRFKLIGRLKKVLSEIAATYQSGLCDLGLRTCKECRALHRAQKSSQQAMRRSS